MNTSQFMDKQILGLAASAPSSPVAAFAEILDLMSPNPQKETEDRRHISNGSADDVLPSYDSQPIRTTAASTAAPTAAPASWGSLDSNSKAASASYNLKSAGILEPHVLKKVSHEDDRSNFGIVTMADIDRTMKKYSDNLLHAVEVVSSRLLQLEGRTHHLENSVDELKLTIGNCNGSTDRKLRQLENMLREVQAGVQILRDQQEIVETQLHLAKLQTPKTETQSSENSGAGQADSRQQPVVPPQAAIQQQHQVLTPSQPPALPALPAPNAPPPPPMLQSQPPSQFPGHLPHLQVPSFPPVSPVPSVPALPQDPYYTTSAQPTETMHQQYQAPPVPQPQAPPAPPQQYQPPLQYPQYSQQPQSANVNPSTPLALPAPQQPEETMPYAPPPQSYPPNVRPPSPYMPPPSGPAPPFYGQNPSMYEPPASRPNSGPPPSYGASGYGPQGGSGFSESYGYTGSPSHHGNAGMKSPSPFAPSGPSSGGSGNYGRLPTAQILPQAAPISSSPSGSSGNRVPLDDVVEKVATMGFSREQVRATVRTLTENGQNVDLNMVLDKLMNDSDVQPQKADLQQPKPLALRCPEAAQLAEAITKKQPHSEEIIRIVSTRSKSQLRATFQRCKEEHGSDNDEDINNYSSSQFAKMLKNAVWCLTSPEKHFAEVIRYSILGLGTDEDTLTRAIVSRAEIDMKKIKEEYKIRLKTTVTSNVVGDTSGYYMDILLTLVGSLD